MPSILQVHLRSKQLEPGVDLLQLARDLPGLVGADIANIVNEAHMCSVRAGRQAISMQDMFEGVDRLTQGERRAPLPDRAKVPLLAHAAKEVGIALVSERLRSQGGRLERVERCSIQPKGQSFSRTLFERGPDEDYHIMTRGKMLDRMKVMLAGGIAVRVVLGEENNFIIPDIARVHGMAERFLFYFGFGKSVRSL